ncbi:hypothetical protein J5N97_012838 [Dioscorea zingiberensis]|uniref:Uncharacterized protein n=1 Tax=Dioscorea zingiberensis TaxID=325984 RepID=A0A9D5CQS6_9LILI|nr:hypothetical protein J5N97_012838 [Dioscorea zingiberensis]
MKRASSARSRSARRPRVRARFPSPCPASAEAWPPKNPRTIQGFTKEIRRNPGRRRADREGFKRVEARSGEREGRWGSRERGIAYGSRLRAGTLLLPSSFRFQTLESNPFFAPFLGILRFRT